MKALITGASGFVGSFLAEELLSQGWTVIGVYRPGDSLANVQHLANRTVMIPQDLGDREGVRQLLERQRPDVIFHVAGLASVALSWRDVDLTFQVNVLGTTHLLEAVRDTGLETRAMDGPTPPRLVVIGSGEEYGPPAPEELPLTEESPLRPRNPYAVSKVAQSLLCQTFVQTYHLHVVYMRPFNHIGPRQGTGFVVSDFAAQVAAIEAGLREPVLRVGNLAAQRDFCDVRDVVRAYVLAAASGRAGEVYNVASERPVAIEQILHHLLAIARVPISVEPDPSRLRPADTPILIGSAEKLRRDTGWKPVIALEQSLGDALDYWRGRVKSTPTKLLGHRQETR